MRIIVSYSSLVDAAIIENVPALALSLSFIKATLIIRSVFKEELAFPMKFIIFPFTQIKTCGSSNLLDFLFDQTLRTLEIVGEPKL